jgi:hypothetical protein
MGAAATPAHLLFFDEPHMVRFIDLNGGVEGEEEFAVLVLQLDELSKGVRSAFGGYAPLILYL